MGDPAPPSTPTEQGEARIPPRDPGEHSWSCKIGGLTGPLPDGSDAPMRRAVEDAFVQVTGGTDEFCFSGWGATLTEGERECVDADTEPAPEGEGEVS